MGIETNVGRARLCKGTNEKTEAEITSMGDRGGGCFGAALDYATLMRECETLSQKHASIRMEYLGNSLLSRRIPMLSFGKGEKSVLYVAGHHASEWLCGWVLLRFLYDIAECDTMGRCVFGQSVKTISENRRIYVVPILNVDGVELQIHGNDSRNPLIERLLRANGSPDFTHWKANARGVDLNHNYNAGFEEYKAMEIDNGILGASHAKYSGEYPESEPEVAALCNFLRYTAPSLILTLHSQGEEIFGGDIEGVKNGLSIGRRLAEMSSYKLSVPEGTAAYGGLSDWYTREMKLPSFTLECGIGENPLPLSDGEQIYRKLRRALFTAPLMV